MRTLEPVDLTYFTRAPVLVTSHAFVAAKREAVFAAIAGDPAGWASWFPGFDSSGRWETPEPQGVGSVRTVRAFRTSYRETILAWDAGERWAFRVDQTSSPMFGAFAEDYQVADAGPGTLLTWTVALRPALGQRLFAPVAPTVFGVMARRAAKGLSRVAGGQ